LRRQFAACHGEYHLVLAAKGKKQFLSPL
jgi:hypothetical protein